MWHAPKFWFRKKSWLTYILWPLSLIYRFLHHLRCFSIRPYTSKIPVICIGNATVGGAGKTPTAIAIGKVLQKKELKVAYLSRGYKGKATEPLKVDLKHPSPATTGDEPLLLAQVALTWVSKNRVAGIKTIEEKSRDSIHCIIIDDGYQNPSLYKDINILVIDGETDFGNEYVFPAGPLREPLSDSLERADALVIIGSPSATISRLIKKAQQPIFHAHLKPTEKIEKLRPKSFIAFTGIARPEKFFNTLKEQRLSVTEKISFPDHHMFTEKDLKKLLEKAQATNSQLITTEKDWVRLKPSYQHLVTSFPVTLEWEDEEGITTFLIKKLHALV